MFLHGVSGQMGSNPYCIATMKASTLLQFVEEKSTGFALELPDTEYEPYLMEEIFSLSKRFTNSIIIALVGDTHEWFAMDVRGNMFLDDDEIEDINSGEIGILKIDTQTFAQTMFVVSGLDTYRALRGTQTVTENDDIPVILIQFKNDVRGANLLHDIVDLCGR